MEYVTFGMHNQQIVDVKEMGERVLPFAIKREEPVVLYHQHQDQYRAPDTDYSSSRARSRSRSPPSKRHRPDNRGKRRDHSRPRGDKHATASPADTRHSNTIARQHNVLCYRCGKKHATSPNGKLTLIGHHHDIYLPRNMTP